MKTFTFTKLYEQQTDSLHVMMICAEWKHGIYGTTERQEFTLLSTPTGTDTVVYPGGEHVDLGFVLEHEAEGEGKAFYTQLNEWVGDHNSSLDGGTWA